MSFQGKTFTYMGHQALNFALERARQFSSGKQVRGQALYEENVNLYLNFARGTTAKAQGTTAIAVGAVGYFEARLGNLQTEFNLVLRLYG